MEPATDSAKSKRARHATRPGDRPRRRAPARRPDPSWTIADEQAQPLRWWQRLRSGVLLTLIAVLLGLAAAAAVGVLVVALFALLRGSVG